MKHLRELTYVGKPHDLPKLESQTTRVKKGDQNPLVAMERGHTHSSY